MRRLVRRELEDSLASYLERLQNIVNASPQSDVERIWAAQRRTASMRKIERALAAMTGRRERCMYCEDSRGTDIEHYRPKKEFKEKAFVWPNLLLICAGCNRCKGRRFHVDRDGSPMLLDPTAEDPWNFFHFDSETGEIVARWNVVTGEEDPRGRYTLMLLAPLRYEAVTEGRSRTWRNLRRAVIGFLDRARHEDDPVKMEDSAKELLEAISDNSDYGLVHWFFLREGAEDAPFNQLRSEYPSVWNRVTGHLVSR